MTQRGKTEEFRKMPDGNCLFCLTNRENAVIILHNIAQKEDLKMILAKRNYSIAIDGPAGAGKSTIAKQLAKKLGFVYLDTGAIYRTVGYHMDFMGIGPKDKDGVKRLLGDVNIDIRYDADGTQHMILNGFDVSGEIRTPQMSKIASQISAHSFVRDFLLETQRDVARKNNVIMDGRDIGTVVLPFADVKIYLTASAEVRAKRRMLELQEKGLKDSFEKVLAEIIARDEQDMNRPVAPLKQAKDAVLVDTSELNLEESVAAIEAVIRERIPL